MSASIDKEQILLDRLKAEIPAFRAQLEACQVNLDELLAHRQLVIESLEMIKRGGVPELTAMYEQLALYGLELAHLNLEVVRDSQRVETLLN